MIFHDVKKTAKGILKDFAQLSVPAAEEQPQAKHPKQVRLSRTPLKVRDFQSASPDRAGPPDTAPVVPTLRLSPLVQSGTPTANNGSDKAAGLRTVALLGLGLLSTITILLGYSAWNAARDEVAYARQGLAAMVERIDAIRGFYAQGLIPEATEAFSHLATEMESFTQTLSMRLLLPRTRTGMTDTELPAATLDFVSHSLSAIRHYRALYDHLGHLARGSQEGSLAEMQKSFDRGTEELGKAHSILSSLRTNGMPPDMARKIAEANELMSQISGLAGALQAEMPAILDALGASYPRRYAVLLQNADEMRPTGGFIGGVLFIDINEGRLTGSEYFDVYELDWRLPRVEAPPPDLAGISPEYGLRDSNRFADLPRSAREALMFFDRQGVPTVDGVIAINQRLLENILSATGPARSASIPIPLTGDNATQVLSLLVESKHHPEKPKTVIKQLVPTIMERASRQPVAMLRVLTTAMRRGDMAAYAVEPSTQAAIVRSGLSGTPRAPSEEQDYLMITESNLGGNKSNRYVTAQVSHATTIGPEGTRNTLRIVRQHGFDEAAARSVRELASTLGISQVSDTLMDIMGRGQNKAMLRIAVPPGSTLLSTAGIPMDIVQIGDDDGKRIFTFPMSVSPGNIVDATLVYALPETIAQGRGYELLIDKQIGQKTIPYDKRLEFATPASIDGKPMTEYGRRIDLDHSQTFVVEWK